AGAVETRHDRADGHVEDGGDLAVAEFADLPQPDRLPERARERAQQVEDLVVLQTEHDVVLDGGRSGGVEDIHEHGLVTRLADPVDATVADDPEGPAVEAFRV